MVILWIILLFLFFCLINYIVYAKTIIHERKFFESLHGEKIYKLDFVVTPHNFIIAKLSNCKPGSDIISTDEDVTTKFKIYIQLFMNSARISLG